MRVLRYEVPNQQRFHLTMSESAQVLHVAEEGDRLFVWALVDTEAMQMPGRRFLMLPTGEEIPPGVRVKRHVGSFLAWGGLHLFEVCPPLCAAGQDWNDALARDPWPG